ncbi:MAG: hypothetical protein A2314_06220 [Elusimicrobia bacterium RIFOXYB2_FULL_50_12]|nr:MAG: hypothetical protein A2314_06220 [Elusimicrobia bacterium RIFOXYB2_FULL_50_12]
MKKPPVYTGGFFILQRLICNEYSGIMGKMKKFILILFVCVSMLSCSPLGAASLRIDTDYRLRGVSFSNVDFDASTSTDAIHYYSQQLKIAITGRPADKIEIGTKITSLGVVGSTNTIFAVPYPRTDFTPYIENAYLKLENFSDIPLDIIIGKQSIIFGDGLVISDNGAGFNALRFIGRYDKPLPLQAEIFTAKISENFRPNSDHDLYGGVLQTTWRNLLWEIGYFEDNDASGSKYRQGGLETGTQAIVKQFYDFRIGKKEDIAAYQFEIVKQGGYVKKTDNSSINLDGMGYLAYGHLVGEKTKLGKVKAHALLQVSSGDDNTSALDDADESFSPDFTRRYDGIERAGYGELFAATPSDSFFALPAPYSGIGTLSVGAEFSPLYAWTFGATYFLYSASQGPRGAPNASGFERLFGAEFALGVELDLSVEYVHSKYTAARFSFNRYTPPHYDIYWPKTEPDGRYQLEITTRF